MAAPRSHAILNPMSDYSSRINRVLDFMDANLDRPLTLEDLAAQACFSPYHFLRIFMTQTGETPFGLLQRLRLEKAANLLTARPDLKILDLALQCGFTNAPAFSRAFKAHFGETPSRWRSASPLVSNFGTPLSKEGQEPSPWIPYIEHTRGAQLWRMRKGTEEQLVEVKGLEGMDLAYIRYTGPYKGDAGLFERLWGDLCRKAGALDLIGSESLYMALYHDNPDLTDKSKLRVTLAVSTAKAFAGTEGLGRMRLEGGKYAFAHFRLNSSEYQEAWDWVYRHWLPQSGYYPDDRPSFELFPKDGEESRDGRYPVVICVPLIAAP